MNKKGFTLIELMIVIAIIAIIAAIAIPSLIRSKISANEGAASASLKTFNGMMATYQKKGYYDKGKRYPTGLSVNDINTGKFCGLHYETNNAGDKVVLIGVAEAAADERADGNNGDFIEANGIYQSVINTNGAPVYAQNTFSARPKQGYWFALCQAMSGAGSDAYTYDLTIARNHYGMYATPAEYGSTGESTFCINEEGTVYSKDFGDRKELVNYPTVAPANLDWAISE